MKEEVVLHLQKARRLLDVAQRLIRDHYANDAARDAYLATYHAAQAYIIDHAGKAAKTHNGAHSQFAQLATLEPRITLELQRFLPQSYSMKALADYEFGEGAEIPAERAAAAVATATRFIDCIAELLADAIPDPSRKQLSN